MILPVSGGLYLQTVPSIDLLRTIRNKGSRAATPTRRGDFGRTSNHLQEMTYGT